MIVYVVLYEDGTFTEIAGIYTDEDEAEKVREENYDPKSYIDVWIEAHEVH